MHEDILVHVCMHPFGADGDERFRIDDHGCCRVFLLAEDTTAVASKDKKRRIRSKKLHNCFLFFTFKYENGNENRKVEHEHELEHTESRTQINSSKIVSNMTGIRKLIRNTNPQYIILTKCMTIVKVHLISNRCMETTWVL